MPPLPELPDQEKELRLARLTDASKAALRIQLLETHGEQFDTLASYTDEIVSQHVRPHWDNLESHHTAEKPMPLQFNERKSARQLVDELGESMSQLLEHSRQTMMEVCPTKPTNVHGLHYRPRKESRKMKKTIKLIRATAELIAKERGLNEGADKDSQPHHIEEAERMATEYEAEHPDSSREDALAATRTSLRHERDKMIQADEKISDQLARRKFRTLVDDNQKLGNKMILGKHKPSPPIAMRAIARPDGSLATSAAEVLEATEQWARKKLKAPEPNGKTGLYLPEDASRHYPWDADSCFSEYKGLLERTAHDGPRQWMHASIDDEVTFQSCLKTLAQGKAAGPDGVANELLQALPPSGKRALHNLLRIMWATGVTPTSWKGSITAMLYKKNTPLELNNYRRIGLEITVYKVWTRMVTFAMADRAERQCMLSAAQAGFRSKRSTAQQIEMMVLALEDGSNRTSTCCKQT